ncbi:unnamed protein product [Rhizophagus irregularis]|uniref:Uncharacterized protein n=1 Tax=Rhizophagus irregularis TaxID=588596 RepID=A0A915YPM1_9GLOM|nr:unnamed protein product [Rhizophagus irregularis]CAB5204918.1 unnamed protein product [Rhizophagus irregularis]CAB5307855.1 unnamed protein product [Rhizophagus irregularis]
MGEELQTYFNKLLTRIDGLKAVTVTDGDGVILIKSVSNDVSPRVLEPALSTTFSVVSDQASKLADSGSNTGVLLDLGNELKEVTDIIASALSERQVIV